MLIELTKEEADDLEQFLHDVGWIRDTDDGRSAPTWYCASCGSGVSRQEFADRKHKPGCIVSTLFEKLRGKE